MDSSSVSHVGAETSSRALPVGNWWNQRLPDWPRIWDACRRRTCSWPIPPRWNAHDWREELEAEGLAAACKALCQYDPTRGTSISSFVYHRVLNAALARYRREWSYALRCASSHLNPDPVRQADEDAIIKEELEHLEQWMGHLVDEDRRLLERLFWEGCTEAEVAGILGITQQAVSKRKHKILSSLRRHFRRDRG
jgi:RNA polymerase sigma factor (sigma-70 family)